MKINKIFKHRIKRKAYQKALYHYYDQLCREIDFEQILLLETYQDGYWHVRIEVKEQV